MIRYRNICRTLRPKIIMSKCVDHKITSPDTHRHLRLATETFGTFPIVCGGSRAQKEKLQKQMCFDTRPMNDTFEKSIFIKNKIPDPLCKQIKRYPIHNSELRLHLNCVFDGP